MIGLEKQKVTVVPYDPEWSQYFARERDGLIGILGAENLEAVVEHVGSTAVPGLAAKPVVDIAIGVPSRDDVGRALKSLLAAGCDYVKAANQPGMLFLAKGSPRVYHYHLVVYGTTAWTKLIVFRDYLRRHRGIAAEYGALKSRLSEAYPDSRLEYMRHKKSSLLAILNRAYWEAERRRHAAAIRRMAQLQTEETHSDRTA